MDLSDIARLGIIYESGKDIYGRPVVVISGSKIPDTSTAFMDKIFMFALKLMDTIVNKDYVCGRKEERMRNNKNNKRKVQNEKINLIQSKGSCLFAYVYG
jgi:hypothetical protein